MIDLNILGKKFGRRTVIEAPFRISKSQFSCKCVCECGNIKLVNVSSLLLGRAGKCRACPLDSKIKIGSRLGSRTIIKQVENHVSTRGRQYLTRCDCGQEKIVRSCDLANNRSLICRSCTSKLVMTNYNKSKNI